MARNAAVVEELATSTTESAVLQTQVTSLEDTKQELTGKITTLDKNVDELTQVPEDMRVHVSELVRKQTALQNQEGMTMLRSTLQTLEIPEFETNRCLSWLSDMSLQLGGESDTCCR